MTKSKKTREYIALGGLGLVLIIALASFLKGNQAKPSTTKAPVAPQVQQIATPEEMQAANSAAWVETPESQGRITAGLVAEVQGGRNPFKDLLMPLSVSAPAPAARSSRPLSSSLPPIPRAGEPFGTLPAVGPMPLLPLDAVKSVRLKYLAWQEAAQVVKAAASDITVSTIKNPRILQLRGPEESMPAALDAITRIDAAPNFQLRGVITTSSANFAVISVQEKTYSLYEGDTIPALGWTVTRITPASVTLQRGHYDPVVIRLAGGKA